MGETIMLFKRHLRPILIGATIALLFSTRALALFHFADIVEIYSNADGTIQFIEMRMTSNSQNLLTGHDFTSNGKTFPIPTNLSSTATLNKNWLMATSGFAALPGAVTPDYIIPDNFFSISGDTLTLVGGVNPDSSVTFGLNVLPIDGLLSMNASGATATNSPTNFAEQTGEIDLSVPPLDPNDVYVDFSVGSGGSGAEGAPFNSLQDAIDAANAAATINIKSGTTTDTFSGVMFPAISKELTLVKIPGVGSVIIGAPSARRENRSGFRSKPIAPRSSRSVAP